MSESSTDYIPEIPTSGDIFRGLKHRFDADSIGSYLIGRRSSGVTVEGKLPIQKDEASKGTPYPYLIVSVGNGSPGTRSSNRTLGNGKIAKHQMLDTPFLFRVHAITDDEAEIIGKKVARSIERSPLSICGSQSFVTLFRQGLPVEIKEGDENYSFTMRYLIRTNAETVI